MYRIVSGGLEVGLQTHASRKCSRHFKREAHNPRTRRASRQPARNPRESSPEPRSPKRTAASRARTPEPKPDSRQPDQNPSTPKATKLLRKNVYPNVLLLGKNKKCVCVCMWCAYVCRTCKRAFAMQVCNLSAHACQHGAVLA